jgi:hypothetical protein
MMKVGLVPFAAAGAVSAWDFVVRKMRASVSD